ncbi:MAG: T9SS type A sorting domain-containing protein [Fibrobacter sp.]|nr:T9SS type A sorting domain-containing protein [Fibrobacter sp.]
MKEGTPLQVSLSSKPKNATVRVERGTIAVAQKSGLKGLRSAKLGNQLHVSFEVPDELVDESTRVELLTAKGGVIATASAKSVFGTNKVAMDVPKNGVYILRVRVGSAQVTRQILVK